LPFSFELIKIGILFIISFWRSEWNVFKHPLVNRLQK
jgi:hypothetical protein